MIWDESRAKQILPAAVPSILWSSLVPSVGCRESNLNPTPRKLQKQCTQISPLTNTFCGFSRPPPEIDEKMEVSGFVVDARRLLYFRYQNCVAPEATRQMR